MEQENQQLFLVLKIIAFESGTTNSHNLDRILVTGSQCATKHTAGLTYHSGRYFPNQGLPGVIKKHDESALMHILQEFATF